MLDFRVLQVQGEWGLVSHKFACIVSADALHTGDI